MVGILRPTDSTEARPGISCLASPAKSGSKEAKNGRSPKLTLEASIGLGSGLNRFLRPKLTWKHYFENMLSETSQIDLFSPLLDTFFCLGGQAESSHLSNQQTSSGLLNEKYKKPE